MPPSDADRPGAAPVAGTALVTGAAGFIGYHVSRHLLDAGWQVIGFDGFDPYYDIALKHARLAQIGDHPRFSLIEARLEEPGALMTLFEAHHPDIVVHLAAQAGVRYSIDNPRAYLDSNLIGTFELLEAARAFPPRHMLLASTSSAYGASTDMPYVETQKADTQMSFYAATKKANEAMAHSYAHLYGLPVTMFRFFTVYGPWGRPDMAMFKFTDAVMNGRPLDVYNSGKMSRDFTYIDDLAGAIMALIPTLPDPSAPPVEGDSLSPVAPFRIVNIGNSTPVLLMDFIAAVERSTGRKAELRMLPMQPGDVLATWADCSLLQRLTGFRATTPVERGVAQFVDWYCDYTAPRL